MRKLLAILLFLFCAQAARAQTRYVDFVGGSDAYDGTAKTHTSGTVGPWKSSPYMQTGSGCSDNGGTHLGYSHTAGQQIIFKGGVTWPLACFKMTIPVGGTSGVSDYYGVDKTWFTGGSFTRPLFDMGGSIPTGQEVITVGSGFGGYVTFDNFEIANQKVTYTNTALDHAFEFAPVGTASIPGVLIENMYMHGWTSDTNFSALGTTNQGGYATGCINDGHDRVTVDHITCEDSAGSFFAGTVQKFGGFGGGCVNCGEVKNSTFHDVWAGCYTVASCHDNEFYNISQALAYCVASTTCSPNGTAPHTQVIEDDQPCGLSGTSSWMKVYNNAIHNVAAGVNIFVKYDIGALYNNVLWSIGNNYPIRLCITSGDNTSASVGSIYNNTALCPSTCVGPQSSTDNFAGTVKFTNNIWITSGSPLCFNGSGTCAAHIATLTQTTNRTMSSTEASTYGYTSANKFKPTSSDPNAAAAGTNLTSSCTGGFSALCQDASGSAWFGGSYVSRPTGSTGWDLGAYQGQGGSSGPPVVTFTSPSAGSHSGTLTLTVTATPQGSATISSCQFSIDGFTFGSPDTSSPYTTTWDTTTASNARAHAITAVCTDSNNQTGSAGPINVTPTNTHTNGFVSDSVWSPSIPNQPFTAQTGGTVVYPICIKPYTSTNNDNEVMLSQALPTTYSDASAIVAIRGGGYIQAYNGTTGTYTTDGGTTAYPVVAATQYCFNWSINMAAQTFTLAETTPTAVTIATNFGFRNIPVTSLGFLSAFATNNSTPDTVEVSNFSVPGSSSLSVSPGDLNFGNVIQGVTASLTDSVTITSGPTTFTSVSVSGTDFSLSSNTCTGSVMTSCSIGVQFMPSDTVSRTGTLTLTDNATGSPQTYNLSGMGIPSTPPSLLICGANPCSNSITTLLFGNVEPFTPSQQGPINVTVISGPANFSSVALTGTDKNDFQIVSNTCGTNVPAACQTVVQYNPRRVGSESATLVFTSNAAGSPYSISLLGVGQRSNAPLPVVF